MLYKQIALIERLPLWFSIETAVELNLFVRGYGIAHNMYNSNFAQEDINHFESFGNYINEKYSVKGNQNWGKVLHFYSENDWASLLRAFDEIKNFKDSSLKNQPQQHSVKTDFNNFLELMGYLEKSYLDFGINSVKDFNAFYTGFVSCSAEPNRDYFEPMHIEDQCFCNFNSKDFLNYTQAQLCMPGSTPPYFEIISYISFAPKTESLELFFRLWRSYNSNWRKNVSEFPDY